mmetsp:Transcript_16790/g.27250  ORF Transcript_16790/g.27250 Transcript_16790/m.27250 type:complete len:94 (+) Transcript_16790:194-475(+)
MQLTLSSHLLSLLFERIYACIGTEYGAAALNTAVKRLTARNKVYDLDLFGGVIAARADRDDIHEIEDLKDKIVAAGSTSMIMGGQMQIFEMMK